MKKPLYLLPSLAFALVLLISSAGYSATTITQNTAPNTATTSVNNVANSGITTSVVWPCSWTADPNLVVPGQAAVGFCSFTINSVNGAIPITLGGVNVPGTGASDITTGNPVVGGVVMPLADCMTQCQLLTQKCGGGAMTP